ncbi:hypothetical protein WMY93_015640 [Mugilogobius chulae]|uniref:Uncharacterized protein n=1 Tax=Mugilogobius chulae TaxID=88201 RepID=A0AAW0P2V9_9GOBI
MKVQLEDSSISLRSFFSLFCVKFQMGAGKLDDGYKQAYSAPPRLASRAAVHHAWLASLTGGHWGTERANLPSPPRLPLDHLPLTPDTAVSLTRRLPTIASPNGPGPPIPPLPIVVELKPVQQQIRTN